MQSSFECQGVPETQADPFQQTEKAPRKMDGMISDDAGKFT